MLYQIKDGTVSLGGKTILSHVEFYIKEKEKLAIVGKNGVGKTTLLRVLSGELGLDRDDKRQGAGIMSTRKITVGMLRQADVANADKTVEEIILSACQYTDPFSRERFEYEMEFDRIFTGLGFGKEDKVKKLREFSGGEQTKISLINLLLQKPDLLLLDEPTNHLDIASVEWLEEYMMAYSGAVVFVSHDRFFLDQVVDAVYELDDGKLKRYAGNYSDYRKQKAKDYQIQMKNYLHQQEEIKRLEALIEKFKHKPSKASFARSKMTTLKRMNKLEAPKADVATMFTGEIIPEVLGSKNVYEAKHLKIGYGNKVLLELSLRIRRGQKIAVIGENGVGKSTFIKTVAGLIPPIKGESSLGNNILMGYFDQMSAAIDSDKSVVEHFHELFPAMSDKDVRSTLGAYLFGGRDAAVKVSDLSGGQKSRLVLAELITAKPNLMILDEPTNHMDITAKETLESAFKSYKGTMLFVSHDRYFVKEVADAILILTKDGALYYPFGYEHYITRLRRGDGENLSALIQAEDQALVESLKAVPKPKRPEYRQLSTDEAYVDWKLSLAAKPLEEAAEAAISAYEEWEAGGYAGEYPLEQEEAWTKQCLAWYEMYIDL